MVNVLILARLREVKVSEHCTVLNEIWCSVRKLEEHNSQSINKLDYTSELGLINHD